MPNRSMEIKVGIAMSVGTLLLLLTIFMLGQDSSLFASTYRLHVAFKKIDGLNQGSVVRLSGLRVGNVQSIEFSEEGSTLSATLKIEAKYKNRITKGSVASLSTQGALGDKYVSIEPGPPGEKPLENDEWLQNSESSDILTALTTRGNELEKIFDILNELQIFTKNLNHENRTGRIMENLAVSMTNLNKITSELKGDDRNNMKKAIINLNTILEKINNGEGTLGALINDPTVYEKLKSLLGGSSQPNQYMKNAIQKTIQKK